MQSRNTIERTYVAMYWNVGQAIDAYISINGRLNEDGTTVFKQLSEDIEVDQRTLYQAHDMYRAYPRIDYTLPLSWSHYRTLAHIKSAKERKRWQERIIREKLSVAQFKQALQAHATTQSQKRPRSGRQLKPIRGKLYHYRLIKAASINRQQDKIVIDCGFNNHVDVPASSFEPTNKRIVASVKNDRGYYTIKQTKATKADLYTYIAAVERVVDGDTLIVYIDCGFGIFRRERLRLKHVDTPEMTTIAGKRAKAFVENELKKCAFVIINSYWEDAYGRYLADLFFQPGESDPHVVAATGMHLNQLLLDEGW